MITYTFRPIEQWPRAFTKSRRRSPFAATYDRTMRDLQRELGHLGASGVAIQLALREGEIRRDGLPYSNARPQHPGVVLSFTSKGQAVSMPCDTYVDWRDNLRAITLSLAALRAVDRYGVTQSGEQYRGWAKLPPPGGLVTPPPMTVEDAAAVVAHESRSGVGSNIIQSSAEAYRACYRAAAARLHPDAAGGDPEAWLQLQRAAEVLKRHHGV